MGGLEALGGTGEATAAKGGGLMGLCYSFYRMSKVNGS